jgi:very-short-patch-repair endonuclease
MDTTNRTIDHELLAIAERQHGLISRTQVSAAGLSPGAWRHRLARGEWIALSPRVARRSGAPPSAAQTCLAAVLDVGLRAWVSHLAAASLWGVPGFRVRSVDVITTRSRFPGSELAVVHRPRHLPDPFASVLDGVPIVRPSLLVLQLASLVHPDRLGRIFDGLWSRRLLSAPSVRRELDGVLGRGRTGTRALREVLAARPPGYVPPASGLEGRFVQIARDHDLPAMRRQVDLGEEESWCGRVDFLAVDVPLVVEVDSDRYHAALVDRLADARRQEALVAAGFTVARIDEFDVWHRPSAAVRVVREGWWRARSGRPGIVTGADVAPALSAS